MYPGPVRPWHMRCGAGLRIRQLDSARAFRGTGGQSCQVVSRLRQLRCGMSHESNRDARSLSHKQIWGGVLCQEEMEQDRQAAVVGAWVEVPVAVWAEGGWAEPGQEQDPAGNVYARAAVPKHRTR